MQSARARFFLRAGVATGLALCTGMAGAFGDGSITVVEGFVVAGATLTAFGTWLGLGQKSESLEPNVGNRLEEGEGLTRKGVG